MKQSSIAGRSIQILAATALLTTSASISSAWAQTERISNPPPAVAEGIVNPRFAQRDQVVLAPTIQFPGRNAHVTTPLTVNGTAQAGSRVQVKVKGNWEPGGKSNRQISRVLGDSTVVVNAQNQWKTAPIKLDVPENARNVSFEISAIQLYADGRKSPASVVTAKPALKALAAPPMVQATAAPMLSITSPENGDKVSSPLIVKGTAIGGTDVDIHVRISIYADGASVKTVRHTSRALKGIPIKNGAWSTPIDLSVTGKKITKVEYLISVTMNHPKGRIEKDVRAVRR